MVNQVVCFDCRMSASEVTAEATVVHVNLRDTQSMLEEGVIASLELNKVDYAVERNKSLRARYYFGIIFLIMNLVAWFFRDYGQSVLLPFIHCKSIFYPFPFSSLRGHQNYCMAHSFFKFFSLNFRLSCHSII